MENTLPKSIVNAIRGARDTRLAVLAREPFLHFVALGLLILLVGELKESTPDRLRITVGSDQVERITTSFELQFGRKPDSVELQDLIDGYVEEEILYREGVAMGLDQGDEIVRRRVAQKVRFLRQDADVLSESTEEGVRDFYKRNLERYSTSTQVSFRHFYFSPDLDGDERARSRAEHAFRMLPSTSSDAAVITADQFPGQNDYPLMAVTAVHRLFGESEFSRALFTLPVGQWSRPLKSGLGWHVALVRETQASRQLPFSEIVDRVRKDYLEERRNTQNTLALAALKERYTVIREDRNE